MRIARPGTCSKRAVPESSVIAWEPNAARRPARSSMMSPSWSEGPRARESAAIAAFGMGAWVSAVRSWMRRGEVEGAQEEGRRREREMRRWVGLDLDLEEDLDLEDELEGDLEGEGEGEEEGNTATAPALGGDWGLRLAP